jgi:hypothetical protein
MRRGEDHARIINHLSARTDAFLGHDLMKIAKVLERIMRRGRNGDAVRLRFFKAERHIVEHASVGIEHKCGLDFFWKSRQELCLPRFSGQVEIVSNNFDLARQTIDIGRCVRDDKNRTIWKFALADRRSQAFDPIRAPNEENDCATVFTARLLFTRQQSIQSLGIGDWRFAGEIFANVGRGLAVNHRHRADRFIRFSQKFLTFAAVG